jgi:hypothetical protein
MPAVASRLPEAIAAVVFISSLIPREGATALETLKEIGVNRLAYRESGEGEVPRDRIRTQLCNDMPDADAEYVISRLTPEPPKPFLAPISRAGLPAVRRIYVRPTLDNAITLPMQEQLLRNLGGAEEVFVEGGHNVIFSQPQLIADVLNTL